MRDKSTQSALWQRAFFERNNFYFGKLMTARDFTDEQSYFNEKRWMMNRFGLGWGVLCGLKVRPHNHHNDKLIVEPGFAIDPYGHEIMVCHEETIELTGEEDNHSQEHPAKKSYLYYVSVKYEECGVNPSAIPIDSCDGYKEECVYNRTREGYRFIVSRKKPDLSDDCEPECHRLLQDPSPAISDCCPERPECEVVPLARICYNPETETTAIDIDMGMAYRKLAFSNSMLFEMLRCMQEGPTQNHDRSQHVPLLASTIKGLKYKNGKNAIIDGSKKYHGKFPFRLTSDGDYIWITDREDYQIWRIDRRTNKPIQDDRLILEDYSWGIAYDGLYMWVSHHDSFTEERKEGYGSEQAYGKLTRINVRTLEQWKIDSLPKCESLPECYRFPESADAPGGDKLKPYTGEIVLHRGHIYVAHDLPKGQTYADPAYEAEAHKHPHGRGYELWLSRIDPVKGCLVELINIPETDDREPWSPIQAMASDGDALWITYRASAKDRKKGGRAVVRKITREDGTTVVGEPYRLSGEYPERMAFDGTRIWVGHDDGVSAIDIETGEEERVDTDKMHTALAYTGGSWLWAAAIGKNEASINRIDILSEESEDGPEIIEVDPDTETAFEISDMQFDGRYLYVAYHLTEDENNRGVIHRLLP